MRGLMLSRMIVLATKLHFGKYDKGGKLYILHPLKVMMSLNTNDEELQCIAIGHDLLEDTDVTDEDVLKLTTNRVLEGIKALTREKKESSRSYQKKVMLNKDAMIVKKHDLEHNLDVLRLHSLTEKDLKRINNYLLFYNKILEKLSEK